MRLPATILSCLALAAAVGACGSSSSSSSNSSSSPAPASSASSTSTQSLSTTAASDGLCARLRTASTPTVTPGRTPELSTLQAKALGLRSSTFGFTGRTCSAATTPARLISVTGIARLRPTLLVVVHENLAGRSLQVRFIGDRIYIYLPEIAARDGGKPWLSADLKRLSAASGLDFDQLLAQIRTLTPDGQSPLSKATSAFSARGRATIHGTTVYVYAADFSVSELSRLGLPGALGRQTADKLRQLGVTREHVVIYVSADGIAVRTVTELKKGSQLLTVSINSSSRIPHPVAVSPPPAARTIPYSKVAGA